MTMRRMGWGLACGLMALGGCQAADQDGATREVSLEACRLDPVPTVSVGGMAPPAHTFGDVSDASLLPDGRVAVADRQARSITIFDPAGGVSETVGREGEGPGEFLDPIGIAVADGTMFVWDWDQSRVTGFDLATNEVGTTRLGGFANPTHHFGEVKRGFVVGSIQFPDGLPESGSWTNDLGVLRWDTVQASLDTLFAFQFRSSEWVDQETRMSGSRTFSPRGTFAAGDGRVYWAEGGPALVHTWDDGVTGTIEWSWPTREVMPGDVDTYRERWLAGVPESAHQSITDMLAKLPVAEVFPTVSDLVADTDGGVWVGIYALPSDTTQTWLRFEGENLTCQLEAPRAFRPTEGGSDWLLGVTRDELDVQSVELRAVRRGDD